MKRRMFLIWVGVGCLTSAWSVEQEGVAAQGGKFLGFATPAGVEKKREIFSKVFPPEFLKLGLGSPAADLCAAFPKPGDQGGKPDGPGYYQGQNFIRDEAGGKVFPYYGHWCETTCQKTPDGVTAIEKIRVTGRFNGNSSDPFLMGTRQDGKAVVSALCACLGSPKVHVRLKNPTTKEMHFFDMLRWDKPEGTLALYFCALPGGKSLSFQMDVFGSRIAESGMKDHLGSGWAKDGVPLTKEFATRFEAFCNEMGVAGKATP